MLISVEKVIKSDAMMIVLVELLNVTRFVSESTGMKGDGFNYTLTFNGPFTHQVTRGTCVNRNLNMPLVSNELSLKALNRSLRAADMVFVDMHRLGDFSLRQFITGQGNFSLIMQDSTTFVFQASYNTIKCQ